MSLFKLCLPHEDTSDYVKPPCEEFLVLCQHFAPGIWRSRQRFAEVYSREFTEKEAIKVLQKTLKLNKQRATVLFKHLKSKPRIVGLKLNKDDKWVYVIGHDVV